MRLAFSFAWRYLFSRKSLQAVNVVSLVASLAVAAVAMALVVTLSVFNGYHDLIMAQTAPIDPDLLIEQNEGRVFSMDAREMQELSQCEDVESMSAILSEMALIKTSAAETTATIVGVDANYAETTGIMDIMFAGDFALWDSTGDSVAGFNIGVGLANTLSAGAGFVEPVDIYLPRRLGVINPLMPASAFTHDYGFVQSVYITNRPQWDERAIVPIEQLRSLLSYDYPAVNALAVKVAPGSKLKTAKQAIAAIVGEDYKVLDKAAQYPDMERLVAMEKWMSFMILIFILLLALFNVVSSVSMLLIEKRHDMGILRALGAEHRLVRRIFVLEGSMITSLGTIVGAAVGIVLVLLQQHYGFISMQSGMLVDSYPVRLVLSDVLLVIGTVILLGYLAALYPVHIFLKKQRS